MTVHTNPCPKCGRTEIHADCEALAKQIPKQLSRDELDLLVARCRDLLDSIAYGVRDKFGMFTELNWNEDYHVEATMTVKDCREMFFLLEHLPRPVAKSNEHKC